MILDNYWTFTNIFIENFLEFSKNGTFLSKNLIILSAHEKNKERIVNFNYKMS